MKRKLLKQISTEWRSNLWLGIELLIVSSILFFIFDATSTIVRIKNTYIGVDITNVYRLTIGWKTKSSPTFETPQPQAGETEDDARTRYNRDNYNLRMQQIRKLPGVISAASGSTSPYNYNFNGNPVRITGNAPDSLKNQENYVNTYSVAPDYPKVFNIRGINGETPEELSRMLEEGKVLLTSNAVNTAKAGLKPEDLINMTASFDLDSAGQTYVIGAIIEPIRRTDYEPAFAGTVLMRDGNLFRSVYVKVKEGYDEQFLDALTATDSPLNHGNSYIVEAKPFKEIRDNLHRNDDAQLRNMIICMGFLLLTVFLGLLGTFWFRTQQRVREIAMRKVTGAGNRQIFRRLMGEGLIILAIATIPALGLDALLVHYGILMYSQITTDIWVTPLTEAGVVFLLMALMIVAGIYFPARKAMKVEPAEVLRGE